MSLSNFCCTLLKFYSQSCSGGVCFPAVDCAQLLSGKVDMCRCSRVVLLPSRSAAA